MKIQIPERIQNILDMLENAGYEAYIVGGCVRDSIMGFTPHDFDVTTSALPKETKKVFKDMRVIETGIKHGTVTVLSDGIPVEITTYRVDGEYHDSRRPESVSFTRSLKEDIARRDFTMNGIAYSPKRGWFDEFGGAEDIKRGIIRCIGDPERRFHEDALRILRGLRFSASLGFEIESNTAKAMLDSRELLTNISAERIFSELSGLLTGRNSDRNLRRVMSEYREIFAVIISELREIFDFEQHSKYHFLDVYEHSLLAAESAARITKGQENQLALTLAMLLHDIGKPKCFTLDEGGETRQSASSESGTEACGNGAVGHFYGHAAISSEIADGILCRLKCSNALRERVCTIVKYHDIPMMNSDRLIRRQLSKYGEQMYCDIALAHAADDLAKHSVYRGRSDSYFDMIERAHQLAEESCFTMKSLAVDGKALMGIVPPSPKMGEVLKYLLDGVVDGKFPNEREILLQEAAKYIAKQ